MKRTTKYVALDVHQATTVAAVREQSGRVIARSILPADSSALVDFFGGMRGSIHVVFEEGAQSQWLHDLVTPVVDRVIVCDRRGEHRGNKATGGRRSAVAPAPDGDLLSHGATDWQSLSRTATMKAANLFLMFVAAVAGIAIGAAGVLVIQQQGAPPAPAAAKWQDEDPNITRAREPVVWPEYSAEPPGVRAGLKTRCDLLYGSGATGRFLYELAGR